MASPENEKNMQDEQIVTFTRLALSLANDYESIYYINTETDSYYEYASAHNDKQLTILSSGADFYTDMGYNVPKLVYPEDRQRFLEVLKKENLLKLSDGIISYL